MAVCPGWRSFVTVFYSGHEGRDLKSRPDYLLPVNGDPNKPEINGYPIDTHYANLAKLGLRSVTVYLDSLKFTVDQFSGGGPAANQNRQPAPRSGSILQTLL